MNHIKTFSPLFFLFIFLIGFSSCNKTIDTKETYLKEYESFIEEIRENKDKYSEEDWKKKDETFTKFSEELYQKFENELSFFEQAKIAKHALVYGSTRGIKALNQALEDGEIDKKIDEIADLFDEDLKKDLDEAIDELKEIWDEDLKDELSQKLEELKEKLEDEEFQEELSNKLDEIKEILNDEEIQEKIKDVSVELNELIEEIEKKTK